MPSLNRIEKVNCENCGTQTTQPNLACHKESCSAGNFFCTQCANFTTKYQNDLNYHNAKKHSAPKPVDTFKCKLCYQEFPGFYASRQHKTNQHGFPIKTTKFDPDDIINEVDDMNLKEKLRSCQNFLVNSEFERARHKVFIYSIENLNATKVDEKLDHFFNNSKCAAKVNLAFGSILKIEDGGFRNFYPHENNTLLD